MKYIIVMILLSTFTSSCFAIELIVDGKIYEIDSYQIEKNGQRIVIPNMPKEMRKPSSFESLMDDLEGGLEAIEKSFEADPHRSKTRHRNFR